MLLALLLQAQAPGPAQTQGLAPVPFQNVKITDAFFAPRIETNRKVTIPACLDQCESTGRIRNFDVASGKVEGKHEGLLFNDSDVYKVLEGAAYALKSAPDPVLEKRVDAIVDSIAAAQREDGYLDTWFQLVEPDMKWKKEREGHELYCAGHLIEAGVAYAAATGKTKLLDVGRRFADAIDREYGPKRHQEATGHEELELALVKLWKATGEKRYLDLASFFVEVRGKKDRGTALFGEYAQDHLPVRDQPEVVGHAVRATYLYCGMADVAAATGDSTLLAPLVRFFDDVTGKKMYVTGGIGSSGSNEGFTRAFDLPNETAYCETCAAVGMALWAHRMFLSTGETRYADVLEREVYNNVPAGVSASGNRFFYDNPLASRGDAERVPWFECACCPPNVARFLPSIGERMYAVGSREIHVLLYAQSTAELELSGRKVKIEQQTEYPRSGNVRIVVTPTGRMAFALHLRVPGWCSKATVEPATDAVRHQANPGDEFVFDRPWKAGDSVVLNLEMPPRRIRADPAVEADRGRVALAKGPVVFALEGVDHLGSVLNLSLPADAEIAEAFDARLGGTTVLKAKGVAAFAKNPFERSTRPADLLAIPYALWANRGKGEMVVWIPEDPALADVPGGGVALVRGGDRLSASHCGRGDTLAALDDSRLPRSSSDGSIPRLTFWDHKGTKEWIQIELGAPKRIRSTRVYWFDDDPKGGCRTPAAARVLVRTGDSWRIAAPELGVEKDRFNVASFPPVETSAVRVEVDLRPGASAGVLEWRIE
jgi:DUF1680 family protein